MLNAPGLEFDIRSRATWLAQALVAQGNLPIDLDSVVKDFASQAAELAPQPDQVTWFAIERLAARTGLNAIKFEKPGQEVCPRCLVLVSNRIEPNLEDAKRLAAAALVVALPEWDPLIQQAKARPARKPGM